MTVGRLVADMDINEMYEWMAFLKIEAEGTPKDERADLIQRAEAGLKRRK